MDPQCENYRDKARRKHLEYIAKKEAEEKKNKEEIDRKDKEDELVKRELINKQNNVTAITLEIEQNLDSLHFESSLDNILFTLTIINSLIENNISLLNEFDKIEEIREQVLNLVSILNRISERHNFTDLESLRLISNIMKNIFTLVEIKIDIELMDTSKDIEVAREIQKGFLDTSKDIAFARKIQNKLNKKRFLDD